MQIDAKKLITFLKKLNEIYPFACIVIYDDGSGRFARAAIDVNIKYRTGAEAVDMLFRDIEDLNRMLDDPEVLDNVV